MKNTKNELSKLFQSFTIEEAAKPTGDKINAVIYTRVSTKEQAENNMSLTTQRKTCVAFCKKMKWNVVGEFGGTYESAANDERLEFNRMLNSVRESNVKIACIVVYSVDRFSRSGANAIYIADALNRQGIQIKAVMQPTDTETPSGMLQQNIHFIFSEYDNQMRRMRCMAGMKERLLKGLSCGVDRQGYERVYKGRDFTLVLNEEGKLLRKAFEWKSTGRFTNKEILDKLETWGLKLRTQKLSKIFRNPFYAGVIVNKMLGGQVVQGKHEACVSKELFFTVNEILEKHPQGWTHQAEHDEIPLKKALRCDCCGRSISGYRNIKKKLWYYRCTNSNCHKNKSAKHLNERFKYILANVALAPEFIEPLLFHVEWLCKVMVPEKLSERANLKRQLSEINFRINRHEERFATEEISEKFYKKFRRKFRQRKQDLQMKLFQIKLGSPEMSSFRNIFLHTATHLNETWESANFECRQLMHRVVFPEGLRYNKDEDLLKVVGIGRIFGSTKSIMAER